jgi:hypothetical protein
LVPHDGSSQSKGIISLLKKWWKNLIIKDFLLDVVDRLCVTFGSDMIDSDTYFCVIFG